jgi:hypothetical protein
MTTTDILTEFSRKIIPFATRLAMTVAEASNDGVDAVVREYIEARFDDALDIQKHDFDQLQAELEDKSKHLPCASAVSFYFRTVDHVFTLQYADPASCGSTAAYKVYYQVVRDNYKRPQCGDIGQM